MKTVTLNKGKDGAIRRRNPWVFSGAIKREAGGIEDGELVSVEAIDGEVLGFGHYATGGIRVRLLHFGTEQLPIEDLLRDRLTAAIALRAQLGLAGDPLTNGYRLVHAAGDGLPGLIVDRYASVAVVQCHSVGMYLLRDTIAQLLQDLLPEITTIYNKSAATLPGHYPSENSVLAGDELTEVVILENGRRFRVNVAEGQKTGFFLDQRDNRWLLGSYAAGKKVLNTFCYTGGFSVYALLGDAAQVQSVDLSGSAIDLTEDNVSRNGEFTDDQHQAYAADVMEWLKENAEAQSYDIIVVDPPAFAKNKHKRHKAVQAYKRLNARALQAIKPGGLLFTFSCSRVVDRQLFYDTIVAAGLEAGRDCQVLHHMSQGADHPVSLYHQEGEYLKGLVVRVS